MTAAVVAVATWISSSRGIKVSSPTNPYLEPAADFAATCGRGIQAHVVSHILHG